MLNANEVAHTRISVWTKWVKFPQWQRVTTHPPVNTSTTLSLTGHSRVLLCPCTRLCVYLSLQSWEESSSIWMLPPVWAVSYLSWTWEAQSRDGWAGPAHRCDHANSSSGTLGAPPLCHYENIAFYYIFLPELTSLSGCPSEKSLPSLPHLLRVLSARPRQDFRHMRLRALLSGDWELSLNFTLRFIGWHKDSSRLLLWENAYIHIYIPTSFHWKGLFFCEFFKITLSCLCWHNEIWPIF